MPRPGGGATGTPEPSNPPASAQVTCGDIVGPATGHALTLVPPRRGGRGQTAVAVGGLGRAGPYCGVGTQSGGPGRVLEVSEEAEMASEPDRASGTQGLRQALQTGGLSFWKPRDGKL